MITLVKTTREIRLILKWGTIILATLTVLILTLRFGNFIRDSFFPEPPPPPEQGFGQLDSLSFFDERLKNYSYRINTVTGSLPILPDRQKVYKTQKPRTFILTVFPIRDRLSRVQFTENEKRIDEVTYIWENKIKPQKKITYNVVTNDFAIEYDYLNDPDVLNPRFKDPAADSKEAVGNFLQNISEDIQDLDFDNSVITYYKIETTELGTPRITEVDRLQNPHVVKVDLIHKKQDELEILYDKNKDNPMHFYVGTQKNLSDAYLPDILEGQYIHRRIIPEQSSLYPLKLAENAFSELQNGYGYIIKAPTTKSVDILNIYLAYYLPNDAEFLRPVVVFEGRDFKAYTDAVLKLTPPTPTNSQ